MTCPVLWKFAPQVTIISGHVTPSTVPPTYVDTFQTILTYPYVSPTITLSLGRAPNFGDNREVTVEAVRNGSLNGVLTMGRNTIWPIIDIFTLDFEGLTDTVATSLRTFLSDSAGVEIGLLDHRGQQWRGFILNPDTAITKQQRCSYSVSLSFRGTLA